MPFGGIWHFLKDESYVIAFPVPLRWPTYCFTVFSRTEAYLPTSFQAGARFHFRLFLSFSCFLHITKKWWKKEKTPWRSTFIDVGNNRKITDLDNSSYWIYFYSNITIYTILYHSWWPTTIYSPNTLWPFLIERSVVCFKNSKSHISSKNNCIAPGYLVTLLIIITSALKIVFDFPQSFSPPYNSLKCWLSRLLDSFLSLYKAILSLFAWSFQL